MMNARILSPLRFHHSTELHEFIQVLISMHLLTVKERDGLKSYLPTSRFNHEFIVAADHAIYFLPHVQAYIATATAAEIDQHALTFLGIKDDEVISLRELQNMPLDIRDRKLRHILMDEAILTAYNSGFHREISTLTWQDAEQIKKNREHFGIKKWVEVAAAVSEKVKDLKITLTDDVREVAANIPNPNYLFSPLFADLMKLVLCNQIKLKHFILHRYTQPYIAKELLSWLEEVEANINNLTTIMSGRRKLVSHYVTLLSQVRESYEQTMSHDVGSEQRARYIEKTRRDCLAQGRKIQRMASYHRFLKPALAVGLLIVLPVLGLLSLAAMAVAIVAAVAPSYFMVALIVSGASAVMLGIVTVFVVTGIYEKMKAAAKSIYHFFEAALDKEIEKQNSLDQRLASLQREEKLIEQYPHHRDNLAMKYDYYEPQLTILKQYSEELEAFELEERESYSPQLRASGDASLTSSGFNLFKFEEMVGLPVRAMQHQESSPRDYVVLPRKI